MSGQLTKYKEKKCKTIKWTSSGYEYINTKVASRRKAKITNEKSRRWRMEAPPDQTSHGQTRLVVRLLSVEIWLSKCRRLDFFVLLHQGKSTGKTWNESGQIIEEETLPSPSETPSIINQ